MVIFQEKSVCDVITKLAHEITRWSQKALVVRGQDFFRIGVSGGSMMNYLSEAMLQITSDLSRWRFYLCDERYVPNNSVDSNFYAFKNLVMPKVPQLKEDQFIQANTELSLQDCAVDYEKRIFNDFKICKGEIPKFDLLLLGLGPDGHTCSLFPNHKLLKVSNDTLISSIDDSPKAPSCRITMTLPLINKAHAVLFAIADESKSHLIEPIFCKKNVDLPAALINPDYTGIILDITTSKGLNLGGLLS